MKLDSGNTCGRCEVEWDTIVSAARRESEFERSWTKKINKYHK